MKVVTWLLRAVLAAVFIYAGALKLSDPARFATEIEGYRLLPQTLPGAGVGAWVAVGLPWLEVVVGLAILLPVTVRAAALWQATLMAVFIVALASAWWRDLDITCGCFGASDNAVNFPWLIGRDLLLLVGALVVFWKSGVTARESTDASDNIHRAHQLEV